MEDNLAAIIQDEYNGEEKNVPTETIDAVQKDVSWQQKSKAH